MDVGDVAGLIAAITWILDRPDEAAQMAKRGREHLTAYDLDCIIKLHQQLYAQALT